MIVALLFAAIVAIALSTYLRLALNTGSIANRSFYFNAAQNLVDAGTEHALWSLNNQIALGAVNSWTNGGFSSGAGGYQGVFPSSTTYYNLSGGAKGQVRVWVEDPASSPNPRTVVQATVYFENANPVSKTIEAYLEERSFWGGGMVSRNGISFNGNTRVDSWISRPTPSDDIPYSIGIARTEARIASPMLISLQNADVYGRASIGTDDLTGIRVGTDGRLAGSFAAGRGIDASRVTFDFTGSFPDVDAPSGTTISAIAANNGPAIAIPTGTYVYVVPSITFSGTADGIEIGTTGASPTYADVTYIVTGNVSMRGNSQMKINPGSKLTMYVAGDFQMGGSSGILNGTSAAPNNPDSFTVYGTRTAAAVAAGAAWQDWDIQGNGYLSAVIFAPNADLNVNGTGDVYGSLVGEYVTMVGSGAFHQDESLKNKKTSGLWQLSKWREITSPAELASSSVAGKITF